MKQKLISLWLMTMIINSFIIGQSDSITFDIYQEGFFVKYKGITQDIYHITRGHPVIVGQKNEIYNSNSSVFRGYAMWKFQKENISIDSLKLDIVFDKGRGFRGDSGFEKDTLRVYATDKDHDYFNSIEKSMKEKWDEVTNWEHYFGFLLGDLANTNFRTDVVLNREFSERDTNEVRFINLVEESIRNGRELWLGFNLTPEETNNAWLEGFEKIKITVYADKITMANRLTITESMLEGELQLDCLSCSGYDYKMVSGTSVPVLVNSKYNIETLNETILSKIGTVKHHHWDNKLEDFLMTRGDYLMDESNEMTAYFQKTEPVYFEGNNGKIKIMDPWIVIDDHQPVNTFIETADHAVFLNENTQFDLNYQIYFLRPDPSIGYSFSEWDIKPLDGAEIKRIPDNAISTNMYAVVFKQKGTTITAKFLKKITGNLSNGYYPDGIILYGDIQLSGNLIAGKVTSYNWWDPSYEGKLIIEKGTHITVSGNKMIRILGDVEVQGTQSEPVTINGNYYYGLNTFSNLDISHLHMSGGSYGLFSQGGSGTIKDS